jgi:predicted nucleic acid-binding protein
MRVLVDTNVVLDVLLNREPWVMEAAAVWRLCSEGSITGY